MPLVTARDFKLTPDTSQLTQLLTQAILQGKAQERQDTQLQQKQQAEQVKTDLATTSAQLLRVRDIKDNATQRREIAKLGQERIKQGKDPSVYNEALNITNPDEMNLYLTRNALKGDTAKKFIEQKLKPVEQFEPVHDSQGNVIAQTNVSTGQVVADPRAGQRAKEEAKALKDDLKATETKFDQSAKLRAEITKKSTEFEKQRGAWARVQASAEDPSPAGDLALIFNFMKVLDPGSTVREGEFAQVGAAGSLPTQVQRMYDQWATGQKLTPPQRADVVDRAKKLFTSAEALNTKDIDTIISIGKQFKIPKKLLLGEEPQAKAPPAAINYLMQNNTPEIRKAFQAKYGYLPEGM